MRDAVDTACLSASGALAFLSSSCMFLRKPAASLVSNTGPLTMRKSCVARPAWLGKVSPATPITFMARPRGEEMWSLKMSPGFVEKRMITP